MCIVQTEKPRTKEFSKLWLGACSSWGQGHPLTARHGWVLAGSGGIGPSNFFFFLRLFWCGPFLKSLLNLLQHCFCFMFGVFGQEACGNLAPWPGIEPIHPALEDEVLTTGLPGRSLKVTFFQSAEMRTALRGSSVLRKTILISPRCDAESVPSPLQANHMTPLPSSPHTGNWNLSPMAYSDSFLEIACTRSVLQSF